MTTRISLNDWLDCHTVKEVTRHANGNVFIVVYDLAGCEDLLLLNDYYVREAFRGFITLIPRKPA